VMHTYSSIFQPPIHIVRVLPVPPLPDIIDHQSMHCVER
jgi:hypothetical protein